MNMINKASDASDVYRIAQPQTLLDVFQSEKGRHAKSVEELSEWTGSPEGKAALASHRRPDGKIRPVTPAIMKKRFPELFQT
jgi:hypothetical protein